MYKKLWNECIDLRESMVYPDCYDIFNCWAGLCVRKNGTTVVATGLKVLAGLGEKLVVTDRYGFCVTHQLEVQNAKLNDDDDIQLKIINRTNKDVMIPYGAILCQVMLIPLEMIGR
jgi:dUTPase